MTEEPISTFVHKYTSLYEKYLLAVLLSDITFYQDVTKESLNITSSGVGRNDFSKPIDNKLYAYINEYYSLFMDARKADLKKGHLLALIEHDRVSDKIMYDDYIVARERLEELYAVEDTESLKSVIQEGYSIWISKKRAQGISRMLVKKNELLDLDMISNIVSNELGSTSNIENTFAKFHFDPDATEEEDIEREAEIIANRMSLGVPVVDDRIDGGIGKEEVLLIVIPSGGGKTTFCTQSAGYNAYAGKKVLFISTEQGPAELFPRIVSSLCEIPFKKIRHGIIKKNLDREEIERLMEKSDAIRANLSISWWGTSNKTIVENLESELIKYKSENGQYPDIVYFDWIGGGISMKGSGKGSEMRHAGLAGSRYFSILSKKYKFAGVITVQADEMASKDKKYIDASTISEMKMVKTDVTLALGISALMKKAVDRKSDSDPYAEIQTCLLWKARKGTAKEFEIERDFDYQRFKRVTIKKKEKQPHRILEQ